MSEREKCICGTAPRFADRPTWHDQWFCWNHHCSIEGPRYDHSGAKWDNMMRRLRLGRELDEAIERGRKLHPWVSQEHQEQALRDEIYELFSEAFEGYEITQRKDIDIKRVVAEAVDTLVCAKRAEEGR